MILKHEEQYLYMIEQAANNGVSLLQRILDERQHDGETLYDVLMYLSGIEEIARKKLNSIS